MAHGDSLPADFLEQLRKLEESYCAESDPIRQSGFGGGAARWRAEREPILDAVRGDGDFLDVGCANGYLLACLVEWARERGCRLTPHGVDFGPRLIQLARKRFPDLAPNFHMANAWDWRPPRRYRYVYSVSDCVPEAYFGEYCRRLLNRTVDAAGTLIVGSYGSRSRGIPPLDLAKWLAELGFPVQGTAYAGTPPVSSFAWITA